MNITDPAPRFSRPERPRFVEAPSSLLRRINLRYLYNPEGRLVKLHCPAHQDGREPNLAIYPTSAHCHACGFHEGVFAHIERACSTRSHAEILDVAMRLLEEVERPPSSYNIVTTGTLDPSSIVEYSMALEGSTELQAYLMRRYGLSPNTQREARLGYSNAVSAYTIPVFNLAGELVNVRYRAHRGADEKMKYWGTANHNGIRWYYNPHILHYMGTLREKIRQCYRMGLVLVTEGELDALALYQLGLPSISSTGGAQSLASESRANHPLFEELRGVQTILAYDQDEVGCKAAAQVAARMAEYGLDDVHILQWDKRYGKDVSEMLARGLTLAGFRSICTMKRARPVSVQNNLTLHNT